MNLSLSHSSSSSTLMWHVLVETLGNGQIAAWVAEFPECRVVADSQDAAIAALEELLKHRLATIKVLPLKLSAEDTWLQLSGILKDNASFVEWSDRFWAEKQNPEDDEELSVEESLRVM
jgi:hypothetical protein